MFATSLACAQPGSGIRIGEQTVITPEVSASVNYNDNVNLRRRALSEGGEVLNNNDSDRFLNTQVSLAFRHWTDQTQWNARAWYGERRYDEQSNLDRDTYGASAGLFWVSPAATRDLSWNASFQRAVDRTELTGVAVDTESSEELDNVSERVERDEIRSSLALGQQLTTSVRGTASYSLTDIEYKEEQFNNRTSHLFTGELSYQFSDKTSPYFRVGLGLDDDEGLDGNAERPFYLAGIRYRPTDKLFIDVAVGYETYTRTPLVFEPNFEEQRMERVPGDELKNSGLKYTANIRYAATTKTRVTLSARNGFSAGSSQGSSSREETALSAALSHQTTSQLSQRISISWREDDYLTPLTVQGEDVNELKETLWYQYRLDYQTVRPWLSLFANLSYEDGSSRIPGDNYTEMQITAGARARY
ncbi:MAG: outer membrane beta-barrel protein [Verrucomicrobia bacterium]|nr:outer membrane beta-barrel protein [Verrucomicrobiota bacterium]MCH8526886.1 outer membrane beta-barrel protein [Kiritimatiellia bacterium]